MTMVVFSGPTLSATTIERAGDMVCLPPAARGDVYRAARHRPFAIGLIDGYFEAVPSVWHKEILWAMAEGVHVFGSASMGALRAAELAPFGMAGVGWIFDAYRDGRLEDDDEVAVLHGPPETGYLPLSEAMVNIRRSLERALAEEVIGAATARSLTDLAKATFYKERRHDRLLADGRAAGLPTAELDALAAWLPAGRIDQKRADALAMLEQMRRERAAGPWPKVVSWSFEHTWMWQQVVRAAPAEDEPLVRPQAAPREAREAGD